MRYRNRHNSSIIVEILNEKAQVRLGETKWTGIAYLDLRNNNLCVRLPEEFHRMFAPLTGSGDKG